jgi:hypothetical protein
MSLKLSKGLPCYLRLFVTQRGTRAAGTVFRNEGDSQFGQSYLEMSFATRSTYDQTHVCGCPFVTCHPRFRSTSRGEPTRPKKGDVSSTPPFPTNALALRSFLPASLPLESFEAPLSCLRPHPKHQGLRRSGHAAQSPWRYNRWAAHRSR